MSEYYRIKEETLRAVGDAIRHANNTTNEYTPAEMVDAITAEADVVDAIITRAMTEYSNSRVTKVGHSIFRQCKQLANVDLPSVKLVGEYALANCTALKTVSLPSATNIYANAFNGDTALEAVIIRSASTCTLNFANAFTSSGVSNGTGYVYVPSALVDSYKAATNWSTYADQIRAIEDYPEITGG